MQHRMLVAYMAHSTFAGAVLDYLTALKQMPGFQVDYVNVEHQAVLEVDLNSYDVVFNNFCARLVFDDYISIDYIRRMKETDAVKALAVQDEYDFTDRLKDMIIDCGFDIVLTCVPQDSLSYVYPRQEFPDINFVTVFTGYVAVDFAEKFPKVKPLAERDITIGYRGRDIGGRYGRMGFDKYEIGRRMKEICQERGVPHNIEMDEDSRIYGDAWLEFIGSCRMMLGAESGSNVFDFDGSIARRFAQMRDELERAPSYEEFLPIVEKLDGEIEMGQISPRVFECAVSGTGMILYRGRYSDALIADEHYIALEKDFSNIDDVLKRANDLDYLAKMVERTYEHLVVSGKFGYGALLEKIAEAVSAKLTKQTRQPTTYVPAIDWFTADPMKSWDKQPATNEVIPPQFFRFQRGLEKQTEYRNLLEILRNSFKARLEEGQRYFRLFGKLKRKSASNGVETANQEFKARWEEISPEEHISNLEKLIGEYKIAYGEVKTHDSVDTITKEEFVFYDDTNAKLLDDVVHYQQVWDIYTKRHAAIISDMSRALSDFEINPIYLYWERCFGLLRRIKNRIIRKLRH